MTDNIENKSSYAGLANKIRGGKSASTIEIENREPKIRFRRKSDRGGFSGRGLFRVLSIFENMVDVYPFGICVDDEQVASLQPGESVTLKVKPGTRKLSVTTPLASKSKTVDIENGHTSTYLCQTSMLGLNFWKSDR